MLTEVFESNQIITRLFLYHKRQSDMLISMMS